MSTFLAPPRRAQARRRLRRRRHRPSIGVWRQKIQSRAPRLPRPARSLRRRRDRGAKRDRTPRRHERRAHAHRVALSRRRTTDARPTSTHLAPRPSSTGASRPSVRPFVRSFVRWSRGRPTRLTVGSSSRSIWADERGCRAPTTHVAGCGGRTTSERARRRTRERGGERRARCQPSRCGAEGADDRTRRMRGSRSNETGEDAERRVERKVLDRARRWMLECDACD
jgi:hypothetical protein